MDFPLSPPSIGALIKALAEGNTHTELGTLFMSLGIAQWDQEGDGINKERRVQGVLKGLQATQSDAASKAAMKLARHALVEGAGGSGLWDSPPAPWWQPLIDALAADGFDFYQERGELVPAVAGLSVSEERSVLEENLRARGWGDAAAHYRQCADGVSARNWESANGQGRSFLEDLIPRVASEMSGKKAPGEPQAALQFLQDKRLLPEGEFNFARGLWEMCNSRGSHAGRSDEEEARFRFLAISAYGRFLLSRLD
jgi:hypothetical protein